MYDNPGTGAAMNDQLDVLREVVAGLDQAGIAYMVSGSTALNYYAEPRMTRDIDIVIELGPHETARFEQIFSGGFYLDKEVIEQAVRDRGMFNLIHLGRVVKVDFIVRKDSEYRRLEFSRRRRVEAEGLTLHLVSPEDLILSKLEWIRQGPSELQLRDVQSVVASVPDLDWPYLRSWAGTLGLLPLLEKAVG
jgi:hypothetical protein